MKNINAIKNEILCLRAGLQALVNSLGNAESYTLEGWENEGLDKLERAKNLIDELISVVKN